MLYALSNFDQTGYFLAAIVSLLVGWDLYQFRKKDGCSVSTWFFEMNKSWSILVLIIGIVLGHLFWPIHQGN
jgi:uncharacterized membrane protein YiaA